jgi:NADH:ubiquinone oxidoreductase subunit 2 (subunit N)
MLFLVSSYDLISLYLAIELQSLCFYVLAAFQRNNEFSTEAGLKYFILGALSSGFLLFGESILYGFTGITNFEELTKLFTLNSFNNTSEQILNNSLVNGDSYLFLGNDTFDLTQISIYNSTNAIIIGLLFMLVAFLFKIGAAPFHM